MVSVFYFLGIGVCVFDGILGLILNLLLHRSLWKSGCSNQLYRIPIIVSVAQGGLLCLGLLLLNPCHIFREGTFIVPLFGPIANLLPRTLSDVVFVIVVVLVTMMWTLIPVIGVLQLLALSRFHVAKWKRLACAFVFTIVFCVEIAAFTPGLIPTETYHVTLAKITRELYQLDNTFSVVLYGSGMDDVTENDNRSLLTFLITIVIIPYTASYVLFLTLVLLIRRQLLRFGAAQSARTIRTHRALYIMQLLQDFLPLAIISVPLTLLIIGGVFQLTMDFVTVVLTVFIWLCPSVQALVQLRFVRQSGKKSPEPTRTANTTTMIPSARSGI